jgi:hypothetical protein
MMRCQLQDRQPVLLVVTILAFSSGARAFTALQRYNFVNHRVRGDLTRRFVHVGNPMPSLPLAHANDTAIKSTTMIPLPDFVPIPAIRKNPSGLLASSLSLLSQEDDVSKEPIVNRDLVQPLDRDIAVPIVGGLAVAILLAVGASVSGLL